MSNEFSSGPMYKSCSDRSQNISTWVKAGLVASPCYQQSWFNANLKCIILSLALLYGVVHKLFRCRVPKMVTSASKTDTLICHSNIIYGYSNYYSLACFLMQKPGRGKVKQNTQLRKTYCGLVDCNGKVQPLSFVSSFTAVKSSPTE